MELHLDEAARRMGFEVVEEKEESMEQTKKPHICEVLGVEVGEWFAFDGTNYKIDGWQLWSKSENYTSTVNSLCLIRIIENKDHIIRKPRFTKEEIIAIRLIGGSYLARDMDGALSVWNSRPEWENGAWLYVLDRKERACGLPGHLFPGVKNGECVNIEEYTFA